MIVKRLILLVALFAALPALAAPSTLAQPSTFDRDVDNVRNAIVSDPVAGLTAARRLRGEAQTMPTGRTRTLSLATADWLQGEALIRANRPRDAVGVIDRALRDVTAAAPDSKLRGDLLVASGAAAAALGNVQATLARYQKAYDVYGAAKERRGQAVALQNLASIYRDAGDFDTALRYNAQSIDLYSSEPALLVSAYNNSGNAYTELHKYRNAEAQYQRALSVAGQLNSPLLVVRILQNIARAQVWAGDLNAADATLQRAYPLASSGPAASWRPALDGVAALAALRRHQLDAAAHLIDRTFAEAGSAAAAMPMIDFQKTAYEIFRERGEIDKAFVHLEAFKQLDDEKRQVAASTNAALMSAKFDFARQEAQISESKVLISEGKAAQAQLYTNAVIGLLIAASVIAALLLIGFISIRRSRDQVRAANATLSTTNIALERALAAKTEFLATTSHEIRTPLNGILGMTQVILADRALSHAMRGKIELVHGAGETMKALVDDILDVAKMETGELVIHPEEMDLTRLLGDAGQVWAGQAETKGITLAIEINEAPNRIVADEVRLRQIVFNLMSNAIKFTDRGHVRLTAVVGADDEGERLIIRIEDSGIGIPAAQLETIFESFRQVDGGTTRRHGGTGLGLAICRNLAEAMGGTVRVESTIGLGSTFTLDLPLVRGQASNSGGASERREVESLADAAMLLIEANPLSQGILRAVIGGAVRSLHIVSDLDAANAALQGDLVDHVVADGGVLGLDTAAAATLAAAAHAANARLTLLWPAPDDATRAALADAGADQIIAKPIAAPELLAALQNGYTGVQNSRDIAA